MEQFNSEFEDNVKEKSIYLVHLDNTRIVILASVFVSIVALSFLIGMKLSGPSDELFLDGGDKDKVVESQIQNQDGDDLDALLSSDNSMDSLDTMDDELLKEGGVVTQDKADNIVPENNTKQEPEKKKEVKQTTKKTEKKPVVAASVKKDPPANSDQKEPVSTVKKGFSIQIASFDTRSKAVEESASINRMNYDSYIALATVKGKRYYRVKIGPFSRKADAFSTLDNLQSTTRYKDSYITYEK